MKIKSIISSIAVAASLGLSSSAYALGAVAYSYLELTDFQLFNEDTGGQLAVTDFSFINIGDSASASAVTSFGPGAVTASPNTVDTVMACSGATCGAIGENDATQQPVTNFGRGDTFGEGAIIAGTGGQDFANVWTVAEGRQNTVGFTTGQSGARNTTEFTFALAEDTTVRADFNALSELFVQLEQDGIQAQASYSWNITILDIDADTEVFSWAPDGTCSDPGGAIGGTCVSDDFSLNDSRGQLSQGQNGTGLQSGFFSALVTLAGQTNYRLTIGHQSQINTEVERVPVPEPSILFLLGAGMALMGFRNLQGRKKA